MNEEWLGYWWRPGSRNRVGGRLVLDEQGVKLTLFGKFFDWSGLDLTKGVGFPLSEAQVIPVIHGRTLSPISVLNARCDFPVPPGTDGFEGWHAEAVVEAHISASAEGTEPTFTGVRLELQWLPAWARARGIATRHVTATRRTEVAAQPYELERAVLPSGETVSIVQEARTSHRSRDFQITQHVRIAVTGTSPAGWTELLNRWLQPLQVLLWLSTGVTGRVEHIELAGPRDGERSTEWARLWASLVEPAQTSEREVHPGDVLLFANELPRGFGPGLTRWLSLWEDLRHVLGPLYGRAAAPFAYANDRFYTAAAAIEAYHRYCVGSERDLGRAEHRQRVDRIDELTARYAPELRSWAVNAVKPFNRVPFWRRIVDIAEVFPVVREHLFGDRLVAFAKSVEAARHGHAHALVASGPIEGGEQLYVSADVLVWLLRACLLVDLGIPVERVEERLLGHDRFAWTARRLKSLLPLLDSATG